MQAADLVMGAAVGALATPLGAFTVICRADGLYAIHFPGSPAAPPPSAGTTDANAHLTEACDQLRDYFAGALRRFTLALSPGGTSFQRAVWRAVSELPFGEVTTYAAIAARLDRPMAARAVGHANGANPLPVVVPCHRLVGRDGELRGYAGGLAMKRWLLDHERTVVSNAASVAR